jgi:hypothetical protein
MTRWWFLAGSLALFAAAMALPVGRDEGPPRQGVEYLALGGYFLAGFLLPPACLLYAAGGFALATRRRRLALGLGCGALALGIVGVVPLAGTCEVLAFPAYWVWLASIAVLLGGAFRLPRPPT